MTTRPIRSNAQTPASIARRTRRSVPAFALYGEAGATGAELLHIEEIQSRSRLYRWEIDAHVHRGLYQVVWIDEGSARLAHDELRDEVDGPAAIVTPAGTVHAFRFAPGTRGWVLSLSPRSLVEGDDPTLGQAFEALFESPAVLRLTAPSPHAVRIAALMRELGAEFTAAAHAATPVVGWMARAVVWRLAQARNQSMVQGERPRRHEALFTRFVALVEQHHREHWSIAQYASRLGLTPERLNRLARTAADRSALELIHDRLMREACRRLIYIAAPVSQLAFELGFEDPAYFCRFFKRRMGMSPSAYRSAHAEAD